MTDLPPFLVDLADTLASMHGVVSVVLGGSHALGTADLRSDWDLGVYYRGELDTGPLARLGEVHPPGSWGRVMNGGAWLTVGDAKVDVLLRDLDVVEKWSTSARAGEFEVDALLGYLAGVPTYSLLAERAVAVPVRGELPEAGSFPATLAEVAPRRWRLHSNFSVQHARMRAQRGDVTGAAGQMAKAVIEEAHARLSARSRWVLNEKGIVEASGLGEAHTFFSRVPSEPRALVGWVDAVGAALRSSDVDAQ